MNIIDMDPVDPLARQEAASWHARLQSRGVTNEELDDFYRWRAVPANERAFQEIARLWDSSAKLDREPEVRSELLRLLPPLGFLQRVPVARFHRFLPGAALAFAVAVLLAVVLYPRPDYATGVGEKLVVKLEDGSRVTLNTDSSVSVEFDDERRAVRVDRGQVLFEVAHDVQRPFVVASDDSEVTAIGTVFEVSKEASGARVLLISGHVSVKADGAPTAQLTRTGDTIETGGSRPRFFRSDAAAATSWVNGQIDFRDVPLEAAIREVNRYSSRKIILDHPSATGTRVTGIFSTGDVEAFASAVETLLPLRQVRKDEHSIHLVERR